MNSDHPDGKRVESSLRIVVAILIGAVVGATFAHWRSSGTLTEYEPLNADDWASSSTLRPDPKWRPSDVVKIQLEALEKAASDPRGFELCYRFASTENRAAVGTLENFTSMVSAMYGTLLGSKSRLIGEEVVDGNSATVLASCIGGNGRVTCYRFILVRSIQDANPNCWVTDSVLEISDVATPPAASPPKTKSVQKRTAAIRGEVG